MKHPEAELQIACVKWLRLQYPNAVIFHSPSEGHRTFAHINQLQSMGFSPGFPDLIIINPISVYHGLAIEFKNKSKQTDNQLDWEMKLTLKCGWCYYVIYSFDKFVQYVNNYFRKI